MIRGCPTLRRLEKMSHLYKCLVTVFPLLNSISNAASNFVDDLGVSSTIRRIPLGNWILFLWDMFLFILTMLVVFKVLPATSTMGAYFQFAFKSFAFLAGIIIILQIVRMIYLLSCRSRRNGEITAGEFLWYELTEGFLHLIPLTVLWMYLPEAGVG